MAERGQTFEQFLAGKLGKALMNTSTGKKPGMEGLLAESVAEGRAGFLPQTRRAPNLAAILARTKPEAGSQLRNH